MPLLVRTIALRAVFLVTTWVAAGLGDVPVAAYQVSVTVWSFLAFALDALAIAGQALTGKALGAGDVASARSATRTMTWWGVLGGAVLGAVVLALHQVLPPLFTSDPAVQHALAAGLVVVAVSQPLSGLVFVLDGVLIGAGDGRWLAGAQVAVLLAYLPLVLSVRTSADRAAGRLGHRRDAGPRGHGALVGGGGVHGAARPRAGLARQGRRLARDRRRPLRPGRRAEPQVLASGRRNPQVRRLPAGETTRSAGGGWTGGAGTARRWAPAHVGPPGAP